MTARVFALTVLTLVYGSSVNAAPPKFVLQWGSGGSANGQFGGAHGIEVDADGNVYVADTGNHRIQKFTSDGTFLLKWGTSGTGPGQFNHPHGLGIGPMGNVYVAETGNNRVQKFTSEGIFITMWGSFGDGDGQFRHNHGLAVDGNGNVFVADRNQNRVQKFTTDGTFVLAFGTPGTGDGEFSGTNGIAIDGDGNVFVGDSSPRIQKFTNDGVFITSFGSGGTGDGQFNFPRGLSTDDTGNLYVADRNLHRMQKFTGAGVFLAQWGSFGAGEGQFNLPYGLRAGANGVVYVSDSNNFRVQMFQFARTIYVDGDATSATNDGSSWCSAFLDLQDALAASTPGDTILVAGGVYRPDRGDAQTPGVREASFALIIGVKLYGGYAGCGALDPDERDVDLFETRLSGDLAGNDGPNFASNEENSFHLLTGDGTDSSTVLDGFTVVGGNANANQIPHDAGGGMRIHNGSPTIHNCVFTGNSATFGGGMENFVDGNPTISACLFVANRAMFRGGGMHNNTASPTLIDTVFLDNVAVNSGGGMRNWNASTPDLTGCEFISNYASFGGGMVNDSSHAALRDCIFRGNTADGTSGGMHNWISNPTLVNCLFVDNEALTKGGAIFSLNTSVPSLTNCTLSGNFAGFQGGGLFATDTSTAVLTNCIVWGNTGGALGGPGSFVVSFSDIEGGATGQGNIYTDPVFVDSSAGNLRLGATSPCIDAGNNSAVPVDISTDLDGSPRFVDDAVTPDAGMGDPPIVDMGAFEFACLTECCVDAACADDGDFCTTAVCIAGSCNQVDNGNCGACCDLIYGVCTNNIPPHECQGQSTSFFPGNVCDALDSACAPALGACCQDDLAQPGGSRQCASTTFDECSCSSCDWFKRQTCEEVVANSFCQPDFRPIPTVSAWGILIIALLLLTFAKIVFGVGGKAEV